MKKVTIFYKSGNKVRIKVEDLVVHTLGGRPNKMEWKTIEPRGLAINLDEVESVWMGWHE